MKIVKVFVYGTLKVGGRFAKEFNEFRTHSVKATLRGTMYSIFNKYPAVALDGSDNVVQGELHTYSNKSYVLNGLDRIEGYNNDPESDLYNRVEVIVETEQGKREPCFVYVIPERRLSHVMQNFPVVEEGRWPIYS